MTEDALREAAKDLPVALIEERRKGLQLQIEWIRDGIALVEILGIRVPRCTCGKFFIAKRKKQSHCPACARRISRKNWRAEYERVHGRPYQQKREPKYVMKVRRALKESFPAKPTLDDRKDLAAGLSISLGQCDEALEIIAEERKQKRADPARKSR